VHVSTVLPALQVETTSGDSKSAVTSEKIAEVAAGFMAVLKVNTTDAPGETPVAPLLGIVETSVGAAAARCRPASNIITARSWAVRFIPPKRINDLARAMGNLIILHRERLFVFIMDLSSASRIALGLFADSLPHRARNANLDLSGLGREARFTRHGARARHRPMIA
jgi:hypothetical protein